jgi:hypothetical protein
MNAEELINRLYVGGGWGYYWTLPDRHTYWWPVGDPDPIPSSNGKDVYFGVHAASAVPETDRHGTAKPPEQVRCRIEFVKQINHLFAEFDFKNFSDNREDCERHIKSLTLAPSVIVFSGMGYHAYWILVTPWMMSSDEERAKAAATQAAWVTYVGGSNDAKDLARVLRVPGTFNHKYDAPIEVKLIYPVGDAEPHVYTLQELEDAIISRPLTEAVVTDPKPTEQQSLIIMPDANRLGRVVKQLYSLADHRRDEYQTWLEVGMSLTELGSLGLTLWDDWSKSSKKYEPGACAAKWGSFVPGHGITLGSLAHWAQEDSAGKQSSVFAWGSPKTAQDALLPLPVRDELVQMVIERRTVNIIYAPPGKFKTMLGMDMGVCIAAGIDWLPDNPNVQPARLDKNPHGRSFATKQCPVLFLDFDQGQDRTQERVAAALRSHELDANTPFYYYSMPTPWLDSTSDEVMDELGDFINNLPHRPGLIIVDTLSTTSVGADENSPQMQEILSRWRRISEKCDCSILIIHHENKLGGYRGSTSIAAGVDNLFHMSRGDDGDPNVIKFYQAKTRGARFRPIGAIFYFTKYVDNRLETAIFYNRKLEKPGTDEAIIELLRYEGKLNQSSILLHLKDELDIGRPTVIAALDELAETNRITLTEGPRKSKIYELVGDDTKIPF